MLKALFMASHVYTYMDQWDPGIRRAKIEEHNKHDRYAVAIKVDRQV